MCPLQKFTHCYLNHDLSPVFSMGIGVFTVGSETVKSKASD